MGWELIVLSMPIWALLILCAVCFAAALVLLLVFAIRARRARAAFLAEAVHDLRAPMTNIKGYADALSAGEIPPERVAESLSVIAFEADRAARLAEGLIGPPKSAPTVFGVCDLLRYLASVLAVRAKARGLSFSFSFSEEEEYYVYGSRDALTEVLYNLCDNAVKYAAPGGSIRLSAQLLGDSVTVAVENPFDGDASDVPASRYLASGFRGKNAAVPGSGLGLAIAARMLRSAFGTRLCVSVSQAEPEPQVGPESQVEPEPQAALPSKAEPAAHAVFTLRFTLPCAPDNPEND